MRPLASSSADLHVRRWPRPGARAAALLLHGMESHADWFAGVGAALAQAGVAAVAYDRAGWGRSAGRPGHLASPAAALRELEAVAAPLRAEFQAVHLVGLSWGGLLALFAAQSSPAAFASYTALAPALFTRRHVPLAAKLGIAVGALCGWPRLVALPIEVQDFSRRADAQQFIRTDDFRRTAVAPSFYLSTLRMQAKVRAGLAGRLRAQILLAETDALVDNTATERFARTQGIRVQTLSGTAHSLVWDDPEGVARAVAAEAQHGA